MRCRHRCCLEDFNCPLSNRGGLSRGNVIDRAKFCTLYITRKRYDLGDVRDISLMSLDHAKAD